MTIKQAISGRTDLTGMNWEEALAVVSTLDDEIAQLKKENEGLEVEHGEIQQSLENILYVTSGIYDPTTGQLKAFNLARQALAKMGVPQ